jgi:hypothetical protein
MAPPIGKAPVLGVRKVVFLFLFLFRFIESGKERLGAGCPAPLPLVPTRLGGASPSEPPSVGKLSTAVGGRLGDSRPLAEPAEALSKSLTWESSSLSMCFLETIWEYALPDAFRGLDGHLPVLVARRPLAGCVEARRRLRDSFCPSVGGMLQRPLRSITIPAVVISSSAIHLRPSGRSKEKS